MDRITLKSRPITKVNIPEVPEHPEKQQKGFIVILLLLVILLVAMTPVSCAIVLTLLTGAGAAAL